MSARRALQNELIESPLVSEGVARRAAVCARRAETGADVLETAVGARRALPENYVASRAIDAPATVAPARRAIVEDFEPSAPRGFLEDDAPTLIAPPAFAAKDIKKVLDPRKLLAVTGVLAAIGATTGALITGPSVVMAASQPSAASEVTTDPTGLDAVTAAADLQRNAENISRDSARRALSEWEEAEAAEAERVKAEQAKNATPADNIAPGQVAPLSVEQAIAKAESLIGNPNYEQLCLKLSAEIYGYATSGAYSAIQAARTIEADGQMRTDIENIPVGALVWYDGAPAGNPYGHVAVYIGNGMVVSNGAPNGVVGKMSIHECSDVWGQPLIGWSGVWLPNAA